MKRPGFALIEILIAAGLMGLMGMVLMTTLSSSIDAKEDVEEVSDRYHQVRQAMSRMVRELSMAYLSAHVNNTEIIVQTGFRGENDLVHFTALGHVVRREGAKEGGSHELSYFVGPDDRTGKEALLRREDSIPDEEFDEGGREQVLCPDVIDLTFEYWDTTTEDWKDKWDSTESATLDRLPPRIRITLIARMADGEEQTFMTQTQLWMPNRLRVQ
jgi:general secretion pathway protein J